MRKFEPIGLVTLVVSLGVSIPLQLGVAGATWSTVAPFINIALALALPAVLFRTVRSFQP